MFNSSQVLFRMPFLIMFFPTLSNLQIYPWPFITFLYNTQMPTGNIQNWV